MPQFFGRFCRREFQMIRDLVKFKKNFQLSISYMNTQFYVCFFLDTQLASLEFKKHQIHQHTKSYTGNLVSQLQSERERRGSCLMAQHATAPSCMPAKRPRTHLTWWRHHMEMWSALLALSEENPLVPNGFLHKGPVMRGLDVVSLEKLLNKLSNLRWFGTPWLSLQYFLTE